MKKEKLIAEYQRKIEDCDKIIDHTTAQIRNMRRTEPYTQTTDLREDSKSKTHVAIERITGKHIVCFHYEARGYAYKTFGDNEWSVVNKDLIDDYVNNGNIKPYLFQTFNNR